MTIELGAATSPDVGAIARPLLIVPLGATEQHGPHLPMSTDTTIATAWARGTAARFTDAVVGPALPYGSSGEHQHFPGTISIGAEALVTVLVELVRSASETFANTVFLSGHAGNLVPMRSAANRLRAEGRPVIALVSSWPPGRSIDAHAGRTETSIMLELVPSLVDLDRARAGNTDQLDDLLPTMRAGGVAAVSANGVLGDPGNASADEGRALLDDLVDRTVVEIEGSLGLVADRRS